MPIGQIAAVCLPYYEGDRDDRAGVSSKHNRLIGMTTVVFTRQLSFPADAGSPIVMVSPRRGRNNMTDPNRRAIGTHWRSTWFKPPADGERTESSSALPPNRPRRPNRRLRTPSGTIGRRAAASGRQLGPDRQRSGCSARAATRCAGGRTRGGGCRSHPHGTERAGARRGCRRGRRTRQLL